MLYGSHEIQNIILNEVNRIEDEKNIKVIAGAMLGSIAKGIPRYFSDYDTRFLYINKNFMDLNIEDINLDIPKIEGEIVYRYFPTDEQLFYDRIPFWELTAFLNFLRTPAIDSGISVGIYNMIPMTMLSPYIWDPYGVIEKIRPLIIEKANLLYEINYWLDYIYARTTEDKYINLKKYLDIIHAILTLKWIIDKEQFAPIHIDSLLAVCNNDEIAKEVNKLKDVLIKSRNKNEMVEKVQIIEVWGQCFIEEAKKKGKINIAAMNDYICDEVSIKKMLLIAQKSLVFPSIYKIL